MTATTTTVSAATAAPNVSTNDTISITVVQVGGSVVPTGTVNLSIDGSGTSYGTTNSQYTPVSLTANGTATYTANFATAGAHTIVAQYLGDSTNAPSTGSVTITVGGTSSGKGTISVAGTSVSVAQGSSGTSTITVTPKSGYAGTVDLSFDTSNNTALSNLCYDFTTMLSNGDGTVTVTGASPVTTQLQFDAKASDCVTGASVNGSGFNKNGLHTMRRLGGVLKSSSRSVPSSPLPLGAALAGMMLAGFLGKYSKKLRALACVLFLGSITFALSACGSSVSGSLSNPPKGTYTITLTGTDSATSSITAQTTFTLTIN